MNRRIRLLLLFVFFFGLQLYFLVYEGVIKTGDGTISRFIYANYDQVQYSLFFMTIFLFLYIHIVRIPVLKPEYYIRLRNRIVSYVVEESVQGGAFLATVLYGIILATGLLFGLHIDSFSYVLLAYGRLVLYFIAGYLLYWMFYFITEREVLAMVGYLLSQWVVSVLYSLIDFYVFGLYKPSHNVISILFAIYSVLIGLVATFVLIKKQRKDFFVR